MRSVAETSVGEVFFFSFSSLFYVSMINKSWFHLLSERTPPQKKQIHDLQILIISIKFASD